MGDSAGAHLAAMVALAGDAPEFTDDYPDDPYAGTSTAVKAVIGVYGVYDLTAQWEHDVVSRPADNITEKLMGFPPMQDRRAWFSASPIAHATFAHQTAPRFYWPMAQATTSSIDANGNVSESSEAITILRSQDQCAGGATLLDGRPG